MPKVYWLSAASVGAAVLAVVELFPQAARAKIMHMAMIKLMSFFIILFLSIFHKAGFRKYLSENFVDIFHLL
jgi:hypothetical protein